MLVAKDKIKTNIGEYFLYMFQIEDLIRACNFNKEIIESNLVAQYQTDELTKNEIKDWYYGLTDLMIEEKLEKKGQLGFISNKITEVNDFHQYLLQKSDHIEYQNQFNNIIPLINDLKSKQKQELNDINILLNAIYGIYLLKLQKKEVSNDTLLSAGKFSKLLAELSKKFSKYESGELKIE